MYEEINHWNRQLIWIQLFYNSLVRTKPGVWLWGLPTQIWTESTLFHLFWSQVSLIHGARIVLPRWLWGKMSFLWLSQSRALSTGLSWGMCFQQGTADAQSGKQHARIPLSDKANSLQRFLVCSFPALSLFHCFTHWHKAPEWLSGNLHELQETCLKKRHKRLHVFSGSMTDQTYTPTTLFKINASVTTLEAAHAHSACTHSFHSDSLYSQPDRHTWRCCFCLECTSHHEDMEMKNKL